MSRKGRARRSSAEGPPSPVREPASAWRLRSGGGFTLVEVLMVVVILAILASMTFGYFRAVEHAKVTSTRGRVHCLGIEAATVAKLKGFPPVTLEELASRLSQSGWVQDGKFVDAWDHPFDYRVEGKTFRLWSCGADRGS